jgi:hypothetical protein
MSLVAAIANHMDQHVLSTLVFRALMHVLSAEKPQAADLYYPQMYQSTKVLFVNTCKHSIICVAIMMMMMMMMMHGQSQTFVWRAVCVSICVLVCVFNSDHPF